MCAADQLLRSDNLVTTKQTLHRQDQTIELGTRHGYRIEGDHVFINADIQVPPGFDAEVALQLWATEEPHRGGALTGLKVAELALELPTPIGACVHHVDARVPGRLPLQGRAHAMVLALVERGPEGQESVHAFANYAAPQIFIAPRFEGTVGYRVDGREVELHADAIFNPRSSDNLSGTLSVELWAFPESSPPEARSPIEGVMLASSEVGSIAGQSQLWSVERRVAFSEPPAGRFRVALVLAEWTLAGGYVARDRRDFACLYERTAPERDDSTAEPVPLVVARPAEKLRLVPPVTEEPATVVAAPAATKAPGAVSIQTASVEELAAVKGLTLKIAKEIIKARPFASLDDLIRVRGIGSKTIVGLKRLLTL